MASAGKFPRRSIRTNSPDAFPGQQACPFDVPRQKDERTGENLSLRIVKAGNPKLSRLSTDRDSRIAAFIYQSYFQGHITIFCSGGIRI